MGTSRKKVLCVFRNERGPRAREDVITDWRSTELNPTGRALTDFFIDIPGQMITKRTKVSGDLRTIKLSNVCKGCNGGWMSRLEDSTRPILEPMIRGIPTTLAPSQQRQVAAWGQLKCLTLDAYYLNEHDGIQHLPKAFCTTFINVTSH